MRKQQRVSLVALVLLSSLCLFWLFFAHVPLAGAISDLTLEFLDDFMNAVTVLPTHGNTASNATADVLSHKSASSPRAKQLFSHVYVVSLPRRTDRRAEMEKLRQVVDLNWTYVDAVPANSPAVTDIMQQVVTARDERLDNPQFPQEFAWPIHLYSGAWEHPPTLQTAVISPSLAGAKPTTFPRRERTVGQEAAANASLTCATGNKTSGPPFHHSLPSYMILSPSKIACWYSHVQVLRDIVHSGGVSSGHETLEQNEAFLILEDDINVEPDFRARIREAMDVLPAGWDMLFLGHCWSNEAHWPALNGSQANSLPGRITVHPSYAPKCTHAYAVSLHGAATVLAHLAYPPFAYSRALDQAYSWLILTQRLKSYSVVPSIAVQRKVSSSDVDPGENGLGSAWRESLVHGVL